MIQVYERPGHLEVRDGSRAILLSKRHAIYANYDLTKQNYFDMFWSAVENQDGVVDCSQPRVHRYKDGLEFELTALPEEECDYERFYQVQPDDLVFDLGAYCGVSTVRFAKKCRQVVAVEPDSSNWVSLRANLKRHGIENVVLLKAAVTPEVGAFEFFAEGALGSGLALALGGERIPQTTVEVKGVTLEWMVRAYGTPSFIKMDIERAEVAVLRASLGKIPKTHFAVDAQHGVTDEVRAIFREHEYHTEETPEIIWAF